VEGEPEDAKLFTIGFVWPVAKEVRAVEGREVKNRRDAKGLRRKIAWAVWAGSF